MRVSGVSLISDSDTASPLSVVFTVRLLPCLGRGQRPRRDTDTDTDTAIDTGAAMPFHQISAHRTACTSPTRPPTRPPRALLTPGARRPRALQSLPPPHPAPAVLQHRQEAGPLDRLQPLPQGPAHPGPHAHPRRAAVGLRGSPPLPPLPLLSRSHNNTPPAPRTSPSSAALPPETPPAPRTSPPPSKTSKRPKRQAARSPARRPVRRRASRRRCRPRCVDPA